MTAIELIQYIIDNNLIQKVLDNLGCHGLKEYSTEYRCGLPGHKNKTSISIKKDTLKTKIYQSDSGVIRGDLLTLVMTVKNISFVEANKYLHKLLGLKYQYKNTKNKSKNKQEEKQDPLEIFKKIKRKKKSVNIHDIEIYDSTIIEEYTPLPHINWIREGILPFTCDAFSIGYSFKKNRIVIPWHYWSGTENDIVGVMGRSILSSEQCDILNIPKYLPLKAFPKSLHIYGLQQNYKNIQKAGEVCVYESEKSVLKRHSRLDGTGVAVGSHNLSNEQVRILIGLNISITICYDKDIPIKHIRSECERFYGIRNIFYIYDKYDLMGEKDSPGDMPNKIFNYLLKHKIKYDEKEHKEYLKWKEKQERRK